MKNQECDNQISCYTCPKYRFKECPYTRKKSIDCPLYHCNRKGKGYHDCDTCELVN